MHYKKECIAMLLAGGQGSRLYDLTEKIAKPAVSFGGKYRIIDFPLSNCVNSGIDTVGVMTQYRPLLLNEYVCNGAPWDLDRMNGGLTVLPPYQRGGQSDWYRGTANAVYQNIGYIKRYSPRYVLILSADHIYRMDYRRMLDEHKRRGAVCTVATITVPIDEASRFGICNTDRDGFITEFEEKPRKPKNDQASMGIYIFNTDTLIEYLTVDEADAESSNDFGKNVIPNILNNGEPIYAYRFEGYWRDVGTIRSLWEANMELLCDEPPLNIRSREMRVYSNNVSRPPQLIGCGAVINDSLIAEGSRINGNVTHSVISCGVTVESGATVVDSVIMENVHISSGACIYSSIIDADTRINEGIIVGRMGADPNNITVVPSGVTVFENVV